MSPFREPSAREPEEAFVAPDFRASLPTTVGRRVTRAIAVLVYGAWSAWLLDHVIETGSLAVLGAILGALVALFVAVVVLVKVQRRVAEWKSRNDAEYVAWLMLRDRR